MKEKDKYTAIYIETWMKGSHMCSLERMRRIEKHQHETVGDMLKREGIDDSTVFLFVGHPLLQGEQL
jgi:hypothetical protein